MSETKTLSQNLLKYLWVAVLLIGIFVRFWKMEYVPLVYDADELAYVWAGQSLIQYGQPISWSSFEHLDTQWHWAEVPEAKLPNKEMPTVKFVRPWFDHSFVLPLTMGGWSLLLGYGFPSIPPALWYRLPFLGIAALNMLLVYLIARKVFGEWPALFSLTLLAGSPTLIFAQRMVVSENAISLGILLAIYFFLSDQPLWSVILATAFAGLVKLPGLCIFPVISMALIAEKKYRQVVMYGLGVLALVAAGYGLYGASIDWHVFLAAMQSQSARLLGWSNPAFILSQPGFHTKAILDFSYYLLLFFGMFVFFVPQRRGTRVLAGSLLATWLTVWVTSAEQDMLGWYKIPMFLLLAACSAAVVEFLLKKEKSSDVSDAKAEVSQGKWVFLMTFIALALVNNLGIVRFPASPLPEAQLLRVVVGGILALSVVGLFFKWKLKIFKGILVSLLACYLLQAVYISDQYFSALCRDRVCPTPNVTFSQVVRSAVSRR